MELLHHWRRRAFGAAGATVIAPAAVVLAALAVGVGGGGLAGLGSLGQALTGPQLPVAAAAARTHSDRDEGSKLLAAAQRARAERAARRFASAPAGAPARGRRGGGQNPSARTPRPGRGNGNAPQRPAGGPGPPQPPTPPSEPPPKQPSVIRQSGDEVKRIVEPVPLVGETGAAVVETLVSTADDVCPPPACPLP